jgi:hypothetical protein
MYEALDKIFGERWKKSRSVLSHRLRVNAGILNLMIYLIGSHNILPITRLPHDYHDDDISPQISRCAFHFRTMHSSETSNVTGWRAQRLLR